MQKRVIGKLAEARIAVVSLPMCNLYLQDRRQPGETPRYRGVTLLHELKAAGVAVMCSSDNTRDPFYAYGDMDALEVFREATRIAHLDTPHDDWISVVTSAPAKVMRLEHAGRFAVGAPADLILFRARSYTELLARPRPTGLCCVKAAPSTRRYRTTGSWMMSWAGRGDAFRHSRPEQSGEREPLRRLRQPSHQ